MANRALTLERALVTPEGVPLRIRLAGAGARAGAFTLDGLIMLAALIAFTLLLALAASYGLHWAANWILVLWLLGFFLLRNFYFILFESGARAATPGKRLLKLRVVARDGGRLTGGAVLARNMMREVEVFLPLMFLAVGAAESMVDRWMVVAGFLWTAIFLFFPLFNRDRLRAGDLIAGTWVVENERRRIGADLLAGAPDGANYRFSRAELDAYGQYELQRLEEVLLRDDDDAVVTVAGAIRRKLGRGESGDERAFLGAYYAALRADLERRLLFGRRKRDKYDTAGSGGFDAP